MSIYAKRKMNEILEGNDYQGRGVVIGMIDSGTKAAIAYFIMGRSENSRNRVFEKEGDDVIIYPFDESKVEDPSLIIYAPVRTLDNKLIVTNGDQTDTVRDFVKEGRSFKAALETRCFEPDGPNWTPRISGMLTFGSDIESKGDFTYEMSMGHRDSVISSTPMRPTEIRFRHSRVNRDALRSPTQRKNCASRYGTLLTMTIRYPSISDTLI